MPEREQLEQAIATLEAQRAILGDAVVDISLTALRQQLAALEVQAQPSEPQRKQATILFGDVTGFTAMSETMDAEDVTEVMNALWNRLDQVILDHGGHIDKHIGDAVMAIWGTENAREDDPERAVRAALVMQTQIRAFNLTTQRATPLQMRIGINTGPVLLGKIGITAEFTAMGDTVNIASRLESAAAPGTVLIAQDTCRLIQGIFEVQALEPLAVKGKSEPLQVYQVQRSRPRAFRQNTRGIEGIQTRTVGREMELGCLQAAFRASANTTPPSCQIVTVCGEAGIGKSRLMDEFEKWLENQPEPIQYFKGRADLEMQHQPYALLRDMLLFHFQILAGDRGPVARHKLEMGIGQVLGMGPDGMMRAHFIGQLLGLDFSSSPYLQRVLKDAQQLRDRAFVHLCEFFQATTALGPVIIFLDDVHWADESSLDTIGHLAQTLTGRLLIVCLARPTLFERRPEWGNNLGKRSTRLDLVPLSKADSRRLINEVLQKVEQVPEALRELVVSGADGNPFYMEELIKMFIEGGVILKSQERWQVDPTRLVEARIPPRLTSILQARLDSLPIEERLTLQPAAVIGRTFWDSAIAQISTSIHQELTGNIIGDALMALQNREMIFSDTSTFAEVQAYTFKHAILRDVTYESVLKRDRRRYHALAAQWLIEHSGERIGEYVGLIAEHLEASEQAEQASGYLRQAGEQAAARFANTEAIRYYERALNLLSDEQRSERYEILLAQEGLYEIIGARDAQRQILSTLKQLAEVLGDRMGESRQARIANRWARYFSLTGKHSAAISAAQEAVALAHEAQDPSNESSGYQSWGDTFWHMGDYPAAREKLELALALARSSQVRHQEANCLLSLGIIASRQGDRLGAQAYYEQSLQIRQELGDRRGEGATLNNLGILTSRQGDYSGALAYYEQSLHIRREIGDRRGESSLLNNLGTVAAYLGEFVKARSYYEQSLQIKRETNDRRGIGLTLSNLALASNSLGEYLKAYEFAQQSVQISEEIGARSNQGFALHSLGNALVGLQRWEEAAAVYQRTLDLRREIGDLLAEDLAGLAQVELAQNHPAAAMVFIEELLTLLERNPRADTEELFLVYLVCYQGLQTIHDPRAGQLLNTAHHLLLEQADKIANPEQRQHFLEGVASHREIIASFLRKNSA
jgi:predicted ATPase/class 3 adenylate cyclase